MIRLQDLSFTAADSNRQILRHIDLRIDPGECLGIIGPSGSGKTTLGFHLCGIHRKALLGTTRGSLQLDGTECRDRDLPGFAGIVLQNPASQLFCRSPREEIALGPEQMGLPKESVQQRTNACLDDWGLTAVADEPSEELSHGMKQRVSIAAMLAIQPKLLLLDEPTNFLDPPTADRLFQLLRVASAKNATTIIVIDHDRPRLLGWAHRAICLQDGALQPEAELSMEPLPVIPQHASGAVLLEMRALSFRYGNKLVMDAVDLDLRSGEIVALTGPNGVGKTTLLRLLKGLQKPGDGSIRLCDGGQAMTEIGLVLQDPDQQLFAHTVALECGYWLQNLGIKKPQRQQRVTAALDAVGLSDAMERLPMSLSYGEKRRLALASVLVAQARILCLDEPTVGLDAASLRMLQQQLARHAADGGAVLFATHDLEFARTTAGRHVHMTDGRLEEVYHV